MLLNVGMSLNTLGQQAEALKQFQRVPETSAEYGVAARMRTRILLMAADHSLRDPKEALRLATARHRQGTQLRRVVVVNRVGPAPTWRQQISARDTGSGCKNPGRRHRFDVHSRNGAAPARRARPARQEFGRAAQGMDEGDLRSDQELLIIRTEAVREFGAHRGRCQEVGHCPDKKMKPVTMESQG